MAAIKSPLRYPGGKSRALKQILPIIPKLFNEFREPFVGGASVFTAVKQKNPTANYWINDRNTDVYYFWLTLNEHSNELISTINNVKKNCEDGKVLYSRLKRSQVTGSFGRALRFYVLNRITYSGTVDSGGYSHEAFLKRFTQSKIDSLPLVAKLFSNVKITNENYESLLGKGGNNVFLFLDPPYWKPRKSSLYGKNGDLNKFFDHELFAQHVKECKYQWLITCDDSKKIRRLFSSFAYIYPWKLKYTGMHKSKAVLGKELFITNYELTKNKNKDRNIIPYYINGYE
jgi:DNA adenine methylase